MIVFNDYTVKIKFFVIICGIRVTHDYCILSHLKSLFYIFENHSFAMNFRFDFLNILLNLIFIQEVFANFETTFCLIQFTCLGCQLDTALDAFLFSSY